MHDTGRRMLFTQVDSWMMGINSNVAGKQKRTFIVYAGGAPKYREKCDEVAAGGYAGLRVPVGDRAFRGRTPGRPGPRASYRGAMTVRSISPAAAAMRRS